MIVLGIETSGRNGTAALRRDGRTLAERALEQAGRRHAQTLAAEVQRLLVDAELRPQVCDAVAVSIGPGSFTGLRVGVVFAKTFAYATGCRLAAVDTFQCIAELNPDDDVSDVYVIADAQRGELFVGIYRRAADGGWKRVEDIVLVESGTWMRERHSRDVVTGPAVERLESELGQVCRVLAPQFREPHAAIVAELGERQIAAGVTDDPWLLDPLYFRRSAAEEKADG
jgi:tRNA threonylcarbamoyladenosine biosynthesis protein TsaB